MTNDRISSIEARLSTIEDGRESRNAEINELREALAILGAQQGALASANSRLESAVAALGNVRAPGILALWGPTLATAIALGTLFVFVLNMTEKPLYAEIDGLQRNHSDMKGDLMKVEERQERNSNMISANNARIVAMQNQMDAVDAYGSRRWVNKK